MSEFISEEENTDSIQKYISNDLEDYKSEIAD